MASYWHYLAMPPKIFSKRIQSARSVMVLDCISYYGASVCAGLETCITSTSYADVLQGNLLPFAAEEF